MRRRGHAEQCPFAPDLLAGTAQSRIAPGEGAGANANQCREHLRQVARRLDSCRLSRVVQGRSGGIDCAVDGRNAKNIEQQNCPKCLKDLDFSKRAHAVAQDS